jgi:GMP synthase-like glutamine amidotransferase
MLRAIFYDAIAAMSVNDEDRLPHLTTEMRLIEAALKNNLPVLRICLGAQLIARTLGAAVYPNREKEIGGYDVSPTDHAQSDPLLGAFAATRENLSVARGDFRHTAKHQPPRFLFPLRIKCVERDGAFGTSLVNC